MAKLTYTNERGQSIVLGNSAPYLVTSIDGLGGAQNEIHRQRAPYQDGSTVLHTTLQERALTIEGALIMPDRQAGRRPLVQVFNPKLKGILRYENGGTAREIEVVPELAPVFPPNHRRGYQAFLISLLCPSPFWLDPYTESEEIVTWIGGLRFPWRLPSRFAMKGPPIINIINRGDAETPVRIEFKGPATHPRITNTTTGEYIQVNRELATGDVLVVTTNFGAKRVEINGQNAFNWIDLGSTFWQLEVDDNVIEYSSDDQVEPAAVSISYRNRYVGI